MKRVLLFALGLMLLSPWAAQAEEKLKVVTTIGQITDIVRNVGGDLVSVNGLMGAGVDPHLYRASQRDVGLLSSADVIFFNGLHLEAKMAEIFERMDKKAIAITDNVPKEQLREDQNFSGNYDPHVWFDVDIWVQAAERVRDELSRLAPSHKENFEQNAADYISQLKTLDAELKEKSQSLEPSQRVLVTAHDAFGYFGRRYEFEVLGLQGLSTEAEAGTKDVTRLAEFIAERKIKAIFVESSIPERNIKAVQEAVRSRGWEVKIGGELFSDAMGAEGTEEGTYVGMMRHNMDTIVGALK